MNRKQKKWRLKKKKKAAKIQVVMDRLTQANVLTSYGYSYTVNATIKDIEPGLPMIDMWDLE